MPQSDTFSTALLKALSQQGMTTVFTIPGAHTLEFYRHIDSTSLSVYTPRHEQSIGFMADGYNRMSAKTAICLVISGPGVTNMATPLGQALADSIPMLVISTSLPKSLNRRGRLHEMPDQAAFVQQVTLSQVTLSAAEDFNHSIEQLNQALNLCPKGPVHFQIELDSLNKKIAPLSELPSWQTETPIKPKPSLIQKSVDALTRAKRIMILLGGGANKAAAAISDLATQLDAPVAMTINARGCLPPEHPLALKPSPATAITQQLITQADVVLAIGTEFGQTDYDLDNTKPFTYSGLLIRCDHAESRIEQNHLADIPVISDSLLFVEALLEALPGKTRSAKHFNPDVDMANQNAIAALTPEQAVHYDLLNCLRSTFPNAAFVGDSCQLTYTGNLIFGVDKPHQWFNSSTGFGTLGYALPAAIGAAIANPHIPIFCLIGDGGLQFVLGELATLKDYQDQITVQILVWDNQGYGEIKRYMNTAGFTPVGVSLFTPEMSALAKAFALPYHHPTSFKNFEQVLAQLDFNQSNIIHLNESDFIHQ